MVRLSSFIHLLSFHFTLTFPGTVAVQESHHASLFQPRNIQQIRGASPASLESNSHLVPREDENQMLHTMNLMRRLVEDKGSMVEVSEKDLEKLLDQINTLHSQVNDFLSSKKALDPPKEQLDDKSENENKSSEAESTAALESSQSVQAQTQAIVTDGSPSGPPGQSVTQTQAGDQPEQTRVVESKEQPKEGAKTSSKGQPTDSTNNGSENNYEATTAQVSPQGASTGSSQELSKETASSVLGGRFKETHTRNVIKTSDTTSGATPEETPLKTEGESPEEQDESAAEDECPAADLAGATKTTIVDGTVTVVSEPSANARNTNCTVRTEPATSSVKGDTAVQSTPEISPTPSEAASTDEAPASITSAETVVTSAASLPPTELSASTALVTSVLTTVVVASADGNEAASPQFRTLVFTSVIERKATITVTSLQTELYTVVQSGETFTISMPAVVTKTTTIEEVDDEPLETATFTSVYTDLSSSASDLIAASNTSLAVSDDLESQTVTIPQSSEAFTPASSIVSVAVEGPPSPSYLSSFKTLVKPTTSIAEA